MRDKAGSWMIPIGIYLLIQGVCALVQIPVENASALAGILASFAAFTVLYITENAVSTLIIAVGVGVKIFWRGLLIDQSMPILASTDILMMLGALSPLFFVYMLLLENITHIAAKHVYNSKVHVSTKSGYFARGAALFIAVAMICLNMWKIIPMTAMFIIVVGIQLMRVYNDREKTINTLVLALVFLLLHISYLLTMHEEIDITTFNAFKALLVAGPLWLYSASTLGHLYSTYKKGEETT